MKLKYRLALALPALVALGLSLWGLWPEPQSSEMASLAAAGAYYSSQVQPILNRRCIACHGCYTAPCQMNFQSSQGMLRGAFKVDVLYGPREKGVQPTRLGIDAHSSEGWRQLGFFDVLQNGLFEGMLDLKSASPNLPASERADREARVCPANQEEFKSYAQARPQGGMPYGLPQLPPNELAILKKWLADGAPIDEPRAEFLDKQKAEVAAWNEFFNRPDPRSRLVARYIYEHLFLAHLNFKSMPAPFARLVRSRTPCESGVDEIATPRPNDDPGVDRVYYCLAPLGQKVVEKNHMVYTLSPERRQRWETLFFSGDWQARHPPAYDLGTAGNPFIAFQDIPTKARYQFLLDDARYHVSTFIKGPVCNGTMAVNAVQEQFYVFFLKPDSDPLSNDEAFAREALSRLALPGGWGRDVGAAEVPLRMEQSKAARDDYRMARYQAASRLRPQGYDLSDIWDGDGSNENALLTVFRHDDSAYVMTGARGDLSKTAFVVDYPILERLCYNLVVNFDTFASTAHQVLTRAYMSLIRMEAEELFLSFLPKAQREKIRAQWYQGFLLTQLNMKYYYSLAPLFQESGVKYKDPANVKAEFVNRAIFERMNQKVRGPEDAINWRRIAPTMTASKARLASATPEQASLSRLSGMPVAKTPFTKFFPDFTFLEVVSAQGKPARLYSVVRNKEMRNLLWWIIDESPRRATEDDTLIVLEGVAGSYPNTFLRVSEAELDAMVTAIASVRNQEDWNRVLAKYGVTRMSPAFWQAYDEIQYLVNRYLGVEGGIVDLNRFE